MFNKKHNSEQTELEINNSRLVKELDRQSTVIETKTLLIDKLNKQIDSLTKQMYSSHLNCSVVIHWKKINAVSVRRVSYNTTKITIRKLDGNLDYIDVQCDQSMHEALADEFEKYIQDIDSH